MTVHRRPTLRDVVDVMAARFRILVTKAPRDAVDLWFLVCVLAVVVVVFYASILVRGL
jgi:hypothetical protein